MEGKKAGVKRVAVDFDDVLVGLTQRFTEYCDRIYPAAKPRDVSTCVFASLIGCDTETACVLFDRFVSSDEWVDLHQEPPLRYDECSRAFAALLDQGYELHIVSAREHRFLDITLEFLERFFPTVFSGVHFTNHYGKTGEKTTKAAVCKKISASYLIDDNIHYIHDVEAAPGESAVRGILFGDWKWVRCHERAVSSWEEVVKVITSDA